MSLHKTINDATPEEWNEIVIVKEAKEFNEVVERTDAEIQHPPHYNQGSIECIEGIEAMLSPEEYIGYLRGNSLKYRWRYPFKNGIQDLYKAEFYEKKLLEKLLGQESDE